jgi:hypothetical protein
LLASREMANLGRREVVPSRANRDGPFSSCTPSISVSQRFALKTGTSRPWRRKGLTCSETYP